MSVLRLESVTKSFKNGSHVATILDSINISLARGETVGLLGSSGAGKTTLLNIAGLMDRPTSGNVFLDETDCTRCSASTLAKLRRKNIGFIYQSHHLLPDLTLLENVMLPLLMSNPGKRLILRSRALDILSLLDMEEKGYLFPSQLSGGENQRGAIARAFVKNPTLILADEPTGNLDKVNASNVFHLIQTLSKTLKVTTLVSTHNHEFVHLLSRTIHLERGSIAQSASCSPHSNEIA